MRRSRRAFLFLAVVVHIVLALGALAADSELYGKPLRGLSPVSVAAVVAHPERYEGKTIRVSGVNKGEKGHPVLAERDALLPLVPDGFSLPEDLAGATLTAEGRVENGNKGPAFVATGVEVKRSGGVVDGSASKPLNTLRDRPV